MARPKKWNSESERIAAYRASKREEVVDPALPERQVDEEPAPALDPIVEKVIARAEPGALTPEEEQALRDHFGYAASETRTKAERDEVASRMLGHPSLGITLEQYVARTVAEASAYADSIGETDIPYRLTPEIVIEHRKSDRLARAEAYARWRYAGVQSGEVGSL